jgi:hypothetical protein
LKKDLPLTPYLKRFFGLTAILLGLFLQPTKTVIAQERDFCDPEQAVQFADYLTNTRQYKVATWELERLLFSYPGIDTIQLRLIRVLRMDQSFDLGIRLLRGFFAERPELQDKDDFSREYVRLHFLSGNYIETHHFLSQNQALPNFYRNNVSLASLLLNDSWDEAAVFAATSTELTPGLLMAQSMSEKVRFKSSFLAGAMSTVIPGSGKFYTGQWKDGLLAFIFVAANGYSAYRGFNKSGISSGYGWFFTAVGTSFYIGNIYGSARSANVANLRKKQKIYDQTMGAVRPML